ncbi:hypothetical protein A3K82_03410 [Candidatus Pacearchaeota archaeon RBG_19FT_COMBO_34_9]|nr:MAG: hypothetical protein A3K82_03410 [Candidatus Pacearchaeota archaeon RBG_19FT_COMBO_34_9]OGJ16188.1 MAG: hypothetical protein A3K74_03105 [Candidatus Pacearchaeota archaeon RBG_13_33_26]
MREGNITMKFIRRNWTKFSRLGKKRKKKQVWRRAKGRHSKIREKRKGYPIKVMVGFRQEKESRGLIENKKPVRIMNVKELEKIGKNEIAIIGKIGKKKRIEIAKKAKEKNITILNININKILKKAEKMEKKPISEQVQEKKK